MYLIDLILINVLVSYFPSSVKYIIVFFILYQYLYNFVSFQMLLVKIVTEYKTVY